MVQGHWAHIHQLCHHLTMVDMVVETMVVEALIDMVETIIASDTGKMTTIGKIIQRGVMIVNLGEALIMNPDRKRIHVSVRVVILMKRMTMIGSVVPSYFLSRFRFLCVRVEDLLFLALIKFLVLTQ